MGMIGKTVSLKSQFSALENLKDDSMEIRKAWDNIRDSKRWKITGRR
jgi:hypothetical protein